MFEIVWEAKVVLDLQGAKVFKESCEDYFFATVNPFTLRFTQAVGRSNPLDVWTIPNVCRCIAICIWRLSKRLMDNGAEKDHYWNHQ